MKKRMFSAILAIAMTMSMGAVTAFADGEETTTATEAADAETTAAKVFEATSDGVTLPSIDVSVPTSGTIAINPYNLKGTGQIYSADFKVTNKSEVPIVLTLKDAKVSATTTEGETFSIVTKAPTATATTKDALVNLVVTDGLGKSTTTVLKTDNTDVKVATAMAPLGGTVSYTYTGTTSVSPANAWTNADVITASNAFVFTAQTYTEYKNIAKVTLPTGQATAITVDVDSNADADDINAAVLAALPSTILGDSKELPVTWEAGEEKDDATVYTAAIPEANSGIYAIKDNVTMPTITVTLNRVEAVSK